MKKKKKPMGDKVTVSQFFTVQIKIIRELYEVYKFETTFIILLSCVTICSSFIDLKFLEYMTNSISEYIASPQPDKFTEIICTAGIFIGLIILMIILTNIYNVISNKYQSKIVFETEKKIINKLSDISYEYYESNSFYEKINLAKQASGQYSYAVYGVTQIVRIALMIIVYGTMLSRINFMFIALVFLSILISVIIAAKVTDKQLDYWRVHVSPETRRNNYFKFIFGNNVNHQNIQTTRSYQYFTKKYGYYNKRERKNYLKHNLISFSSELATSVLFVISFLITAVAVGQGVVSGQYEIGYFTMVIALLVDFFVAVKQFTMFIMNDNRYIKILDAYYDVMSLKGSDKRSVDSTEKAIEINGLKYQYPQSEEYALNGIDINFEMGEKIALVGYNGSGKTTLISIILGLLDKYEGSFSRNNTICTAVLQDFGQYQLSVKQNIEIGCGGKELSDEEIVNILKKVDLYDFISSKPDGIHTKLGQLEDGVELSKGQWQRLAIGRLLANKEPNVWILDEPTAYLDPIAEIEMNKFIFGLAENRLVFFISHRLGFAKYADRIVVINKGKIAEIGTHRELMEAGGAYAEMYEAQSEWYK